MFCGAGSGNFKSLDSLKNHIQTAHGIKMLEDRKNEYCCRCLRIFGSRDVALGHISKEHRDWWLTVDTKKKIKTDKPCKGYVGFLMSDDPRDTEEAEEVEASLEAEPARGQKRGGSLKEKDLKKRPTQEEPRAKLSEHRIWRSRQVEQAKKGDLLEYLLYIVQALSHWTPSVLASDFILSS